jgi:putative ABC transport system substrate-binding protein
VLRAVAGELSVTLLVHDLSKVQSAGDFDAILSAIMEERADAVFVFPDFITRKHKDALLDFLLTKHRVPSMFQHTELVEEGGLLGYYTDFLELRRLSASYVDKIFRGGKAADLPVEEPGRFVFIVNLRTAKMLGLTLPQGIFIFADKIIE